VALFDDNVAKGAVLCVLDTISPLRLGTEEMSRTGGCFETIRWRSSGTGRGTGCVVASRGGRFGILSRLVSLSLPLARQVLSLPPPRRVGVDDTVQWPSHLGHDGAEILLFMKLADLLLPVLY